MWKTNEEYVLDQTNRERAILRRSASKKRNGSRSRKVSFPSDGLTKKQKERMNGEVVKYNLNSKMTWKEFRAMPHDLQQMYLDRLTDVHKGRGTDIAEMFGTSACNISTYARRSGLKLDFKGTKGTHKPEKEWSDFMASDDQEAEDVKTPAEEENDAPEAISEVKQPLPVEPLLVYPYTGELTFTGKPAVILESVLRLLEMDSEYGFWIKFNKVP